MSETEPTSEPQAPVNTDGTFVENWHEKYGEEHKAHLSRYKDFDSLVKAQIATKKKLGKDPDTLVEIPTEDSADDVKAAFLRAAGKPDSTDAYEYDLPTELAERIEKNDEDLTAFKKFAFDELDLSPAKFKKTMDYFYNYLAMSAEKGEAVIEERKAADVAKAEKELRKQEGWQSDKEYNDKVLLANSVLRKFGGKEAVEAFGAENSPLMVKFLTNVAGAMSESTLKGLAPKAEPTSDTIKAQITKVRARMAAIQKESPYNFKANPEFKELKQKKTELYKKLSA